MNAMTRPALSWIDRLPAVKGKLTVNAPLGPFTWFRVGGPADVLFKPKDESDLCAFLAGLDAGVPVTVIGVGSNLLVRDGGVEGVVIRLGAAFGKISQDETGLVAGAGALDGTVAQTAWDMGRSGLEFLSGIPGTIGGALRMNAGAYGAEMKDVLIEARAVDRHGRLHTLGLADMGFTYRHSSVPEEWIFLSARMAALRGDSDAIRARMDEIKTKREAAQPVRTRTGGSTFANPDGAKAWELIDRAGCRGLTRGGAQISEKHCNFLINTGHATAADLEELGEDVRARVRADSGIELRWEIRRIGRAIAAGDQQ
jgi:UDP-N-acetylmuramate dehydrogenase